jgi:hypothetical protein
MLQTNDYIKTINKIHPGANVIKLFTSFCIDATYEMRTTEYGEICISIDNQTVAKMKWKDGEREQGSREKERENVCVCV